MKLTIDFDKKTIVLEEPVNLKEATDKLQELLGDEFKDYFINIALPETYYYPMYPISYPITYGPPYEITCMVKGKDLSALVNN